MANQGLAANKMAARILNREDNKYKKELIYDVLKMYMDECRKAVLNGERVQITGVGTIIPKLRTHKGAFNMPICNRCEGNPPPYVEVKLSRNDSFRKELSEKLLKNLDNGIIGLGKLSFDVQQINILKNSGFIKEDYKEE